MGLSIPHLLVVLAIVIIVFGTKRLRNLGADLGGAIKGFRSAVKDGDDCMDAGGIPSGARGAAQGAVAEEDKKIAENEDEAIDVEVTSKKNEKV